MPTPQPTPENGTVRPARVQRCRAGGWRMQPGAVYVGRPTRWGNPFPITEHGRAEVVARYRAALLADPGLLAAARTLLGGRDLACWCPPEVACHAGVLLDLTNPRTDSTTPAPTAATTNQGGTR